MPPTINQVPLGEKLYFFESPVATETRCLILAHGALLNGDGWYDLDPGVKIYYFVPHGQNRQVNTHIALEGPGHPTPDPPTLLSKGPKRIRNYRLWKVLDGS